MRLKDKLVEMSVPLLVGSLTIYTLEQLGISDFMVDYGIWQASFFGERFKNFGEDYSFLIRVIDDLSCGVSAGLITYQGLKIWKDR